MHGIRCILRDSNRIGIQFLFTDLEVALSFLAIAATSGDLAIKQRNWRNARKAHDAVLHLLSRLTPTNEELQLINERLSALRLRLQAVGEIF
jgi:hypothetical protein